MTGRSAGFKSSTHGAGTDPEIDFLRLFIFFQINRFAFKHGACST
jgi:hypothetical protein